MHLEADELALSASQARSRMTVLTCDALDGSRKTVFPHQSKNLLVNWRESN